MRQLKRREYVFASTILLLLSFGLPTIFAIYSENEWLAFVTGLPSYMALVILTFFHLGSRQFSPLWVLPMFINFHFGPSWQIGAVSLYASGFISFLPVILAWTLSDDHVYIDHNLDAQKGEHL